MKVCRKCKQQLDLVQFSTDRSSKDGLYAYCRICKNNTAKQRYANNTDYQNQVKERCRNRSKVVTEIIQEAKASGCCKCPEKEPVCLAFHHLDPNEKDFSVASQRNANPERVRQEIAKCIVVCHNCHAKIHANILYQ